MPPKKPKTKANSVGLSAEEVAGGAEPPAAVSELIDVIGERDGHVLSSYREPYAGNWLVLASVPIDNIEPTPFQRELSDAHAKRLAAVIPKVGRFLDPLIAVSAEDKFWTPNGMHRLEAMRRIGAKSVVALIVPEPEIAYRILALNTEKAHNLKDKSLEVVRMADALADNEETAGEPESTWEFEFEEAGLLTIGRCYQSKARFSGGAYMPVVRRVDQFVDDPLTEANDMRRERATKLLALDKKVDACVKALKESGFQSGYLKPVVVARINPLRFKRAKRGETGPIAEFDETIDKMMDKADSFDPSKIKPADLAAAGAGD